MGEKEIEKEDKPKNYTVKIAEGMTLTAAASADSISTISGSIKQSFDTLRGTFNTNQNNIANTLHLDQNLEYLKKIAEELERSRKLAEEQRDEAIKDAKRERRNFYLSLAVTIILGVVAVIVGILAL
jgi:predicted ribosome quality control (RQC) complex YloA/Tae2 family protein